MGNILSRIGAGLSGFGAGIADPSFAIKQAEKRRQEEERLKLGQILSGQSTPAFLRPGGAEALSPEQLRQAQLRQISALRLPEATQLLTQLSPLTQQVRGDAAPSAVREFKFVQKLTPEEQRQFVNLKRADPLRAKGLVETSEGVEVQPGFAPGVREIARARETGVQEARTEFEPERAGKVTEARKKAELRVARQAAFPKLEGAFQSALAKSDVVSSTIDEVLPRVSIATAGFASILGAIPGTPAADLRANIDTILANIGFEELQEMRDNSPTGGALGQVAVRELELLQATRANILNSQSPTQLRRNLLKLKTQVKGSRKRLEVAFNKQARLAGFQVQPENIPTGQSILLPQQGGEQQQGAQAGEGTTIENPQTGQKLILKGGQWQPL